MRFKEKARPRHMRQKGAAEVPQGDAIDGSPCETCRHHDRVDRGTREVMGHRMRDVDDVCLAAHALGDGGTCFRLTWDTVPDHCPSWDPEVI